MKDKIDKAIRLTYALKTSCQGTFSKQRHAELLRVLEELRQEMMNHDNNS